MHQLICLGYLTHDTIKLDSESVECLGGSVGYAAIYLSHWGVKLGLVSRIGSDFKYLDQLKKLKIDLSGLSSWAGPTLEFRNIYRGSDRVQFVPNPAPPRLELDQIPPDFLSSKHFLLGTVLNDLDPQLLIWLSKMGKLVFLEAQGLLRRRLDSGQITKLELRSLQELLEWAQFVHLSSDDCLLPGDLELNTTLLYTTPQGCMILSAGKSSWIDSPRPAQIKDPTGSGDVFFSGFIYHYTRYWNLQNAVKFGLAAASLCVERIGPQDPPSLDQVYLRMLQR